MSAPRDPEIEPRRPIADSGETRLRVRYAECDPMGVAHHSSYVPWLEIGRTELLRDSGMTYADMERAGVLLVVTRLEVAYKSPARYDDEVVVLTRVSGGKRARLDHAYEVWVDKGDGRGRSVLCATAHSTLACVDRDGRPQALPEWIRAAAHV
ncbi:MAG: thioesterase family protein [Planctomycetota bacterium]